MTRADELRTCWRGLPYARLSDYALRRCIALEISIALEMLAYSRLTR